MTTIRRLTALLAGMMSIGLLTAEPVVSPNYSVGKINTEQRWTPSNSGPQLHWQIEHPATLRDVVSVDPVRGTLVTLKALRLRLNVVGVGRQTSAPPHRAALWARIGDDEDWELLFLGTPKTVRSMDVLVDRTIPAYTSIALAARGQAGPDGPALDLRSNLQSNSYVRGFTNGDPVPSAIVKSPEAFLQAYLADSSAEPPVVSTGPKSILYGFELSANSASQPGFDLQDLVIMLSFDEV